MNSIYLITNRITGLRYVGQTWTSIQRRWTYHQISGHCRKLRAAIDKYGAGSFAIELLTVAATQECADYWEQHFIRHFDTIAGGYNLREGGNSRGRHSAETKRLISERAFRGRKHTEEAKARMSAAKKGRRVSPATEFKRGQAPLAPPPPKGTRNAGSFKPGHRPWNTGTKQPYRPRGPRPAELVARIAATRRSNAEAKRRQAVGEQCPRM